MVVSLSCTLEFLMFYKDLLYFYLFSAPLVLNLCNVIQSKFP